MRSRRRILFYVVSTTLALLLVGAGIALAQGPDTNELASTQAAVGSTFTYQGRLMRDGNPVNDTCNFQFDLFAQASGGSSLQTVQKNNHPVTDGRFTAHLGFAASHFTGDARWVEVAVQCRGDSNLQPLGRQRLRPAPYALGLMPGATISGTVANNGVLRLANSSNDGLRIETAASDGVQITSANYGFYAEAVNNDGVYVESAGRDGVYVRSAANDGVYVSSVGNPTETNDPDAKAGFEVTGAQNFGLLVGHANGAGAQVISAGGDGYQILDAGDDGVQVNAAADAGVEVISSTHEGVVIQKVGDPDMSPATFQATGVEVHGSSYYGTWVGWAGKDGVHVNNAWHHGVYGKIEDNACPPGTGGLGGCERAGVHGQGAITDSYGALGHEILSIGPTIESGVFGNQGDGDYAGYFNGNVFVTGNVSAGSKNFVIDHPQDPENKLLYHSSVESPERMNVYNGNVTTDDQGYATVTLPDYFEALNRDYRYQLTVIGTFAQAIVAQEIENNQFVIQTDEPNVKVSWQVTGIRDDAAARANPMQVEVDKPDDKKGTYLDPEAYGEPASKGMHAAERTRKEGSK